MHSALAAGYEAKSPVYYDQVRTEMFEFLPDGCRRLLDVGCAGGGFAATLRQQRAVEAWGVEPVLQAAQVAESRLDRVIHGEFGPGLDLPAGFFDCIVFNDVLEHLLDSNAALSYARTLLRPGGVVVASIPNIRHFPIMWEIVVRGEWNYRDFGILDRTHLRFFTKKSIAGYFAASGFELERIEGINPKMTHHEGGPSWRMFRLLNLVTLRAIDDMKFLQFAVVARPKG